MYWQLTPELSRSDVGFGVTNPGTQVTGFGRAETDVIAAGTGALKALEIGVSGGKSGPGDTFEDSLPDQALSECSIPDLL
jgi:hypothetical protein